MLYEYKIERGPNEARLNELAAQGWELVGCDGGACYFRRPKAAPGAVSRFEPEAEGTARRESFEGGKRKSR